MEIKPGALVKVMANITFGSSAGTSQKRLCPQFSSNNCYKRKRICGRRHPACRARGRLPRFTEQSSSEPTSGKFQSRGGADWTIACLQLCSEREGTLRVASACAWPLSGHRPRHGRQGHVRTHLYGHLQRQNTVLWRKAASGTRDPVSSLRGNSCRER